MVADAADAITGVGGRIVAGGGRFAERAVEVGGGRIRYPLIIAEAADGSRVFVNVGRVNRNGTPVARGRRAVQDLEGTGVPSLLRTLHTVSMKVASRSVSFFAAPDEQRNWLAHVLQEDGVWCLVEREGTRTLVPVRSNDLEHVPFAGEYAIRVFLGREDLGDPVIRQVGGGMERMMARSLAVQLIPSMQSDEDHRGAPRDPQRSGLSRSGRQKRTAGEVVWEACERATAVRRCEL
jgi:hypothetical protein